MDILLLGGNNYLNMLQQCGLALREAGNRVWSIPYWNNVWLLGEVGKLPRRVCTRRGGFLSIGRQLGDT